jgi:integrase
LTFIDKLRPLAHIKQQPREDATMKAKRRKIKTYEHGGISIRELRPELPEGGGGYYQVDFMKTGRRERKGFPTLSRAKTYCDQIGIKIENEGTAVLSISNADRLDAVAAMKALRGKASLLDAAAFWMRHNGGEDGVTVADLGRRWLAELARQGCRPSTIKERTIKVESLNRHIGTHTVASVTRDAIEGWMAGKRGSTWDTYRRTARAMFQYATEEKLVEFNVAAAIRPMRMDESLPRPMPVDAVQAIMRTAAQWTPALVPVLAVQFFAGLRPGEAMGLDWSAVDFKAKTIRVMPETSKVRRTRIVPMNQTLIDWLIPYRKAAGPIGIQTKSQFSYFMHRKPIGPATEQKGVPIAERQPDTRPKGLLAAAGVDWIQDGPRKTFASAHYALHGDAAKLASILGHTGGHDVLFRHYRGLMSKSEGKRFFAIRPASAGNVKTANFKRASA